MIELIASIATGIAMIMAGAAASFIVWKKGKIILDWNDFDEPPSKPPDCKGQCIAHDDRCRRCQDIANEPLEHFEAKLQR